jgi:hypothetical protein
VSEAAVLLGNPAQERLLEYTTELSALAAGLLRGALAMVSVDFDGHLTF